MGKDNKSENANLRQKAEELIKKEPSKSVSVTIESEMLKQIHELEVHQIELEMQNEELRTALIERKRAEESLNASEKRYRRLFESAKDGILILDAETGMITDVNPFLIEMLGYPEDQFLDRAIWEIGFFNDIVANPDKFSELQQKEYIHYDDLPLETTDGRKISVEFISNSYSEDNNKVIQCNIRETTIRKQSELALRKSESHLRTLVQSIPDLIWLKDTNGLYLSCNPMFERFFGAREADIVGKSDHDFVDRELADYFVAHDRKVIKTGKSTTNEEWITFADDGHRAFMDTLKTPMYDSEGTLLGVLGIGRDITERKQSWELILANQRRFQAIFDQAPIAIALIDMQGYPIISNLPLSEMVGYSSEELAKMKFTEFTYPEDIDKDMSQFTDLVTGKIAWYNMEKRYIHKNGNVIWGNLFVTTLNDKNGLPTEIIGMVDDITGQKNIQNEIKFQADLLNNVGQAVIASDLHDRVIYWNNAAQRIFGWSSDEAMGQNLVTLIPTNPTKKQARELSENLSHGMSWSGEFQMGRKDGSSFPAYVTDTPIIDTSGELIGIMGISSDNTERKRAEQNLIIANKELVFQNDEKEKRAAELIISKEKAEESDRLKSAFLANMSHEVRTPLNSIIGFSELLTDPDFEEDQKTEFIQHIIASGNNLLTIISDIMDISKMESGEVTIRKKPIDAHKYVLGIYEQFSLQAETHKFELILNLPDNDTEIEIYADAERLKQIFNNLIGNAFKFTAKGSIEIGYRPKGEMVEFFVKDTGIGIPASYLDKIFDRFRQVDVEKNRKYGGNGLGLAITKNLVVLMGGKIWLESEEGKGSAFYFTLPVN
ncbi:MAG: PAS domain S-box protein [Prolixibacteraceae bacterium]|nr:PAS domain S-box protein [Prolixibacteraceae bacterium]